MNRIIEAKVVYVKPDYGDGYYYATITKEFAEEHGGGTETFAGERGHYDIHLAVDDLKGMVTLSPGRRSVGCYAHRGTPVATCNDCQGVGE